MKVIYYLQTLNKRDKDEPSIHNRLRMRRRERLANIVDTPSGGGKVIRISDIFSTRVLSSI